MSLTQEKVGLIKVINALAEQGWLPTKVWDGEEYVQVAEEPAEQVAEECAAVETANLYFVNGSKKAVIFMVWGNSPSELIADSSECHGFGDVLDSALRAVWPTWPCVED